MASPISPSFSQILETSALTSYLRQSGSHPSAWMQTGTRESAVHEGDQSTAAGCPQWKPFSQATGTGNQQHGAGKLS